MQKFVDFALYFIFSLFALYSNQIEGNGDGLANVQSYFLFVYGKVEQCLSHSDYSVPVDEMGVGLAEVVDFFEVVESSCSYSGLS